MVPFSWVKRKLEGLAWKLAKNRAKSKARSCILAPFRGLAAIAAKIRKLLKRAKIRK